MAKTCPLLFGTAFVLLLASAILATLAASTAFWPNWSITAQTIPPGPPVLVAPEDGALIRTGSVFFDWDPPLTGDVGTYLLQITSGDINTGPFQINRVIVHPNTEFTGDLGDDVYRWRVIARDADVPPNTATSDTRVFAVAVGASPEPPSPPLDDWTGTLTITARLPGGTNLSGTPVLTFGIRPGCTGAFEFGCDTGRSTFAIPQGVEASLFYPDNDSPAFGTDFQNLLTSRIAPPDPVKRSVMFPVRVEIDKFDAAGATVEVTIRWDISDQTIIPAEFVTVLLIDHTPLPPLLPFNITNMGSAPTSDYTFSVTLDAAGKATRDLTFVINRVHVQAMRLSTGPQVLTLTVKPIFGSTLADIFGPALPFPILEILGRASESRLAGPSRLSVTDEPNLFVPLVITWNHDFENAIPQRFVGVVRVGDPQHPEMVPGIGYVVALTPFDAVFRDAMLIIPGDPIEEHTRSSP